MHVLRLRIAPLHVLRRDLTAKLDLDERNRIARRQPWLAHVRSRGEPLLRVKCDGDDDNHGLHEALLWQASPSHCVLELHVSIFTPLSRDGRFCVLLPRSGDTLIAVQCDANLAKVCAYVGGSTPLIEHTNVAAHQTIALLGHAAGQRDEELPLGALRFHGVTVRGRVTLPLSWPTVTIVCIYRLYAPERQQAVRAATEFRARRTDSSVQIYHVHQGLAALAP